MKGDKVLATLQFPTISIIVLKVCQESPTIGAVGPIHKPYRPLSKLIRTYIRIILIADYLFILWQYNTLSFLPCFPDAGVKHIFLIADIMYLTQNLFKCTVAMPCGNAKVLKML